MTEFPIYSSDAEVVLHLPNSIGEISDEWLKEITQSIKVADNYSLLAIVYREKLSSVILAKSQKKQITAPITPLFVKAGANDSSFISNIECKNKIIISNSQLALGHHVVVPNNELSFERFLRYCDSDTKNTYQRALEHFSNAYVCFVDFKIVPNCDIIGNYSPISTSYKEQFVDVISNLKGEA